MDECGPAKHIYYFDTSKPNQSILTAEAISGMNTVVQIETCAPSAMPSTKTHTSNTVTGTPTTNTVQPSAFPTKLLTKRPLKHTSTLYDNEQSTGDELSDGLRTVFYIMITSIFFCCVSCIVFAIKMNVMKDLKNLMPFWKGDSADDIVIQIASSSNPQHVIPGAAGIEKDELRKDTAGSAAYGDYAPGEQNGQTPINLQHIIYGEIEKEDSEDLFRDMNAINSDANTTTG
eukprot:1023720_1